MLNYCSRLNKPDKIRQNVLTDSRFSGKINKLPQAKRERYRGKKKKKFGKRYWQVSEKVINYKSCVWDWVESETRVWKEIQKTFKKSLTNGWRCDRIVKHSKRAVTKTDTKRANRTLKIEQCLKELTTLEIQKIISRLVVKLIPDILLSNLKSDVKT